MIQSTKLLFVVKYTAVVYNKSLRVSAFKHIVRMNHCKLVLKNNTILNFR